MSNSTLLNPRLAGAMRLLLLATVSLGVAACGVTDRIGKRVDDTWAGDMLFKSDDKLVLTTDAGNRLNPDASGTPLSVVVRVYQLTSLERFAAADADSLWDTPKHALGNTLLDSEELVLLPGFGQVNRWPLAPAAGYVAVAAFFRDTPQDSHWKAAFTADSWRKDGIWFSTKGSRVLIDNNEILAIGGGDLLRPANAIASSPEDDINE
jgi:type VI secretion system protein VasD